MAEQKICKAAIPLKRAKIDPRLLIYHQRNREAAYVMCFWLVPKSTTSDDLERSLSPWHYALNFRKNVFFAAYLKNWIIVASRDHLATAQPSCFLLVRPTTVINFEYSLQPLQLLLLLLLRWQPDNVDVIFFT